MKAVIIIGNNYNLNIDDIKDSTIIACDKGLLFCIKNNIIPDIVIGDFDSINLDKYVDYLKNTQIIKLNPIKDETDTLEAIKLVSNYNDITILGGITGNRIEHFYANILLLNKYSNLKIKDNNSLIFSADCNLKISKCNYKYISIFSLSDYSLISLNGFKYNLNNYKLYSYDPLGVSNEILDEGEIIINKGKILIIQSMEDNHE